MYSTRTKATKQHVCGLCGKTIPKGLLNFTEAYFDPVKQVLVRGMNKVPIKIIRVCPCCSLSELTHKKPKRWVYVWENIL